MSLAPITLPQIVALIVAIIAAITDVRTGKIYNALTLPGALVGIVMTAAIYALGAPDAPVQAALAGMAAAIIGWLAGVGIQSVCKAFLKLLGHGDTKLLGAIGAFIGAPMILATFLYFWTVYAVFAFVKLALAFPWLQLPAALASKDSKTLDLQHFNEERKRAIPIAPFIATGLLLAILFQSQTLQFMGFQK